MKRFAFWVLLVAGLVGVAPAQPFIPVYKNWLTTNEYKFWPNDGQILVWDHEARRLTNANAGHLDVTHPPFKARGDGSDATAAIQAAINAASNRVVYLPEGRYVTTAPLTNLSSRTIRGDGVGSVLIGSNVNYVIYASNTVNLALQDFQIDGQYAVQGVFLKYANGVRLERVKIGSMSVSNASLATLAISPRASTNIVIDSCMLEDNDFDPGDTTNTSAHVTGTIVCNGEGTNECDGVTIKNTIIRNRGTYAVMTTSCMNVDISGCDVDQGNVCVQPYQNGYGICSYDGSHIGGSGDREKKVRIVGNRVYNCGGIGIYSVLGDEVTINENFLDRVALKMQSLSLLNSGICLNEPRRFTVANNIICNVGGASNTNSIAAIGLIAAEYGSVTGNCITNSAGFDGGDGIYLIGTGQYTFRSYGVIIRDNIIDTVTRAGIVTASGSFQGCTFSGNKVFNPGFHGYQLDKLQRCVVENNVVQDYGASGYGFWVLNNGGTNWHNIFRNNTVINLAASRSGAGFRVLAPSNDFSGNRVVGIAPMTLGFQDLAGSNTWTGNFAVGTVTTHYSFPESSSALVANYRSGTIPPTNTPNRVGEMYYDTVGKSFYEAVGTTGAYDHDWHPITRNGVGTYTFFRVGPWNEIAFVGTTNNANIYSQTDLYLSTSNDAALHLAGGGGLSQWFIGASGDLVGRSNRLTAPVSSVGISYALSNRVDELIITNGVTIGNVRRTTWPDTGAITASSNGAAPATITNINLVGFDKYTNNNGNLSLEAPAVAEDVNTNSFGALFFSTNFTFNIPTQDVYKTITNYYSATYNAFGADTVAGTLTNSMAGFYLVNFNTSFGGSGGAGDIFVMTLFTNDVEVPTIAWRQKTSSVDTGSASSSGILYLPASTRLDVRINNMGGTGDINIRKHSFNVHPIAEGDILITGVDTNSVTAFASHVNIGGNLTIQGTNAFDKMLEIVTNAGPRAFKHSISSSNLFVNSGGSDSIIFMYSGGTNSVQFIADSSGSAPVWRFFDPHTGTSPIIYTDGTLILDAANLYLPGNVSASYMSVTNTLTVGGSISTTNIVIVNPDGTTNTSSLKPVTVAAGSNVTVVTNATDTNTIYTVAAAVAGGSISVSSNGSAPITLTNLNFVGFTSMTNADGNWSIEAPSAEVTQSELDGVFLSNSNYTLLSWQSSSNHTRNSFLSNSNYTDARAAAILQSATNYADSKTDGILQASTNYSDSKLVTASNMLYWTQASNLVAQAARKGEYTWFFASDTHSPLGGGNRVLTNVLPAAEFGLTKNFTSLEYSNMIDTFSFYSTNFCSGGYVPAGNYSVHFGASDGDTGFGNISVGAYLVTWNASGESIIGNFGCQPVADGVGIRPVDLNFCLTTNVATSTLTNIIGVRFYYTNDYEYNAQSVNIYGGGTNWSYLTGPRQEREVYATRDMATAASQTIDLSQDTLAAITNAVAGNVTCLLTNMLDRKYFVLRAVADGTPRTISFASGGNINWIATNHITDATNFNLAASKIATIVGRVWISGTTTNIDLFGNVQP